MLKKLKSTAGETISEVLIASLVAVLGVLLFAMMVQSSFSIITSSEEKMQAFYEAESIVEEKKIDPIKQDKVTVKSLIPTVNGFVKDKSWNNILVSVYGVEGVEDVQSYKANKE